MLNPQNNEDLGEIGIRIARHVINTNCIRSGFMGSFRSASVASASECSGRSADLNRFFDEQVYDYFLNIILNSISLCM